MSILDEIARRRRASALRRLGPPPGALPDRSPAVARRIPAAPQRTLESVLPQVLASIATLPARREATPPSDPVPFLAPRTPAEADRRAAAPAAPAAPATQFLVVSEVEEVEGEVHIADSAPVEEPAHAPVPTPPEPRTQAIPGSGGGARTDRPAPLEAEAERRPPPRYEAWLPRPDLLKLTTEPVTGELETRQTTEVRPVIATDPRPVTSTDLVLVSQPRTQPEPIPETRPPSFVERTQLRRRIRFLRQLREVQLRDLGGFALELHRFGRQKPELTASKIEAAAETDRELRQLEYALNGRVELRVVREAGIGGACSHCGAVYGTEDRFCSNCGEALPGTTLLRDDRPPRSGPPTG